MSKWCSTPSSEQIEREIGQTKQMVLCQGKSVYEVILESDDFQKQQSSWRNVTDNLHEEVRFDIVQNPTVKYVIIIEISSDIAAVWKWVRKALVNFLKYDLPDNSEVAIVTFSSKRQVVHKLVKLDSVRVRARLADSVPDTAFKLSKSEERCLICGIRVTMDQVLKNQEQGAHLVILTQGDKGTVSMREEEIIYEYETYYNIKISSLVVQLSVRRPILPFFAKIAKPALEGAHGFTKKKMTIFICPLGL